MRMDMSGSLLTNHTCPCSWIVIEVAPRYSRTFHSCQIFVASLYLPITTVTKTLVRMLKKIIGFQDHVVPTCPHHGCPANGCLAKEKVLQPIIARNI